MPLSWTTVNTHAAGETLPLADWNAAAVALNSMAGTWINQGLVNASTSTGSPPFYSFFGTYTGTIAGTAGFMTMTVPNGGFPNGLCTAIGSVDNTGNTQQGYSCQVIGNLSSATTITWFVSIPAGTGVTIGGTITIQFLAIGY